MRDPTHQRERNAMKSPFVRAMITGMIVAIVAAVVTCIVEVWCIRYSSSSTAAIGFIFLPFTAFIAAIPFFVFGFFAHYAVLKLRQRQRIGYLFAAIAVTLAILFIGSSANNLVLLIAVNNVRTMPQTQHETFLNNSLWRMNKYVLGALLENQNLSAESLHQIAMIPSPDLHDRMWAMPPIMGENKRELAVMRLVARHSNVEERTLIELAKSPDHYVLGSVAGNSKTPVEILQHFFNRADRDYLIDWGLARNPNTPVDILLELVKSSNEYTRRPAASTLAGNPETPVETLRHIFNMIDKDNYWVDWKLAQNPNTPADILCELAKSPNRDIRRFAESNPGIAENNLEEVTPAEVPAK